MHSYCCHQLSYPYIRQLDRLFWTFAITLPSLALADSDPQATIMTAVFGMRVPLMNYRANCHPSVKLQTPNSKLRTPSSKRQTTSVKRQTPSSERQTPSVKRQTPSTKRCPSRLPYSRGAFAAIALDGPGADPDP